MRFCQVLRMSSALRDKFVPESCKVSEKDISVLYDFVNTSEKLLVLTGAGLSTESGIPDYRSEGVGLYARTNRRPIQYADFIKSHEHRRRYWARNYVGWPQFSSFQPNSSHLALCNWERRGTVSWLVTQNVDGLHHKAGSKRVTELHGSTHRTSCMNCGSVVDRWEVQKLFSDYNPTWSAESMEIAPDGDVLLSDEQIQDFKVPPCQHCGGTLIPYLVFFGANVSSAVVNFVFELVKHCDRFLVAGSSLNVYSGYRFVQKAAELNKSIAIVNIGKTRGDHLADIRLDAKCGDILPQIMLS